MAHPPDEARDAKDIITNVDVVEAQVPGLDPVEQALALDLLARITAAITPYFDE